MIARVMRWGFACALSVQAGAAMPQFSQYSFAVISQAPNASDDLALRTAIAQTDDDNLAFVVASGFKSNTEPCSDELYNDRKSLLDEAKNGLIVSLTANDWTECKNSYGGAAAIERLSRLRELFFVDDFSLGASKIPLVRQSTMPKFRSYVENARWEIDDVLFATLNLPATNNHYRTEAGRNSEFEDRLIANRDWLQRTFALATNRKMAGIVLFCDGNPLAIPNSRRLFDASGKRNGFAEVHKQIIALASRFAGKLLVIHNAVGPASNAASGIAWRANMGDLALGLGWRKVNINPASTRLFTLVDNMRR